MKKIIFCILFQVVMSVTVSAAIEIDDYFFEAAIELGYYSRGGVHTDAKNTMPFLSEYGFLGKIIKYKFIVSEDQDVMIHHFGSEMENSSNIYLYKVLEPRQPYEYFENGQIVQIGTANAWMFNMNNQEYDRNNSYYQTNYQSARNKYIQYCNERGLPPPNINDLQPFLFAEGLEKGTYYIISEGYARKSNTGNIYREDGILSTTIMYGNQSNSEAVKEETYMGKYSELFSYTDISLPSEYKEGIVRHKFEITTQMDITISHDTSPKHTSIALLDVNNREIATSGNSPSAAHEGEDQTTLYKQHLAPGIYYILSTSDDVDKYINILVRGYTAKIGNKEEPLALSSSKNYVYTITPTVSLPNVSNITLDQSLQKIAYYDGLGRLEQNINRGASPGKEDLVSFQEYDSYGRESILWDPVPIGGSGHAYDQAEIAFQSANVYKDAYSNTTNIYEPSPLDRVSEQYGAGKAWHKNKRRVKTSYLTNIAGIDTLNAIYYTVTDVRDTVMRINYNRYYQTAQLSVTRVEDEDGSTLLEFKNKLGQLIVTRQIQYSKSGKELYDTYYIYDDFGNQRAVLPPLACEQMKSGSFTSNVNNVLRDYAYLYQYDDRNRCIAKKLPGCDWSFYIYDKADRLIFSQDGNQRKERDWSFSISDRFGRECVSGTCKNTLSPFLNPLKNMVVIADWDGKEGNYKGYTLSGIILVSPTVQLVSYYDNYNFLGTNGIPVSTDERVKYDMEAEGQGGFGKRYDTSSKGLLTGTLMAVLNDSAPLTYLYSVMYYDNFGRLIQGKTSNYLKGVEKEYFAYSFIGNLTKRKHVHSADKKPTQTELYSYTYDHANRLLVTTHQLNGGTPVTLISNGYDELGRLKWNERNGNSNLKTEYTYNIRSWMKSITGPLFQQILYYNDLRANSTNTPCYNGNISGMDWNVQRSASRGYDFSYDNLSRLTSANYLENNVRNDHFNTSYIYDKQGNMLSLSRRGNMGTTTYGLVDNLTLTYRGNQLLKVKDTGVNPTLSMSMDFKDGTDQAAEYFYDANGNMVKDLNKGITGIEYNALNLPRRISFSGANHPVNEYVYSSDGQKLSVTHTSTVSKVTDYVGSMIYENGSLKMVLVDGGYYDPVSGKYYFYLTDHLGNNRVVADASGNVIQATHYYPYGMSFAESPNPTKQPFKYNSKELDMESGLNLYDYVSRQMDPVLGGGRFMSIDPLCEKYYSWSPYVYCVDNPLKYVDPDGKSWRIQTHYNEESKKTEYTITVNAVLYNKSSEKIDMVQLATAISTEINDNYNISGDDFTVSMDFNLKVVDSADEIKEDDHVIQVVDQSQFRTADKGTEVAADSSPSGLSIRIGTNLVGSLLDGSNKRSVSHELGHTGGLKHVDKDEKNKDNLMMQAVSVKDFGGNYNKATRLQNSQIRMIRDNYINKKLHQYSPLKRNWYGKKTLGK